MEKIAFKGGTPVRNKFLIFGAPSIDEEEIAEVVDTLKSGWIGTGKKTFLFEERFARYVGSKYAVAVSSCTAALHLSLLVSGIGPGHEVITSPMTFAATGNAIIHVGATPVFADINKMTLNIDPESIKDRITERTRAILPVHFAGLPCEMEEIKYLAEKYNLVVIEDAAHAIGARYRGKMIGSSGILTCFSFYPNKNITTIEGGMISTNDLTICETLRMYRLHGLSSDAWKRFISKDLILSEVIYPGFKYNMTDVQASLGIQQLKKLDNFLVEREKIAREYDQAFDPLPEIIIQARPEDIEENRHALYLYVVILDIERFKVDRDKIVKALMAENIGIGIHYRALHLHPYYRERYGYNRGDFTNAEYISDRILSLPLYPKMRTSDFRDVIRAVIKVLNYYRR